MAKNKVKYGLKNAHYSKLTLDSDGKPTYATPVPIAGAVKISIAASGDTTPFDADDIEFFTAIANNGYDGTIEFAMIPDQFRIEIMGDKLDDNNVLFENSNAQPEEFALLFEFTGDKNGIRHVLYRCKAARPTIESQTKGKTITPQTDTLSISAKPLPDGTVKAKANAEADANVYKDWYTAVYEKQEAGA